MIKAVLFDLDGTLLPMNQEEFIKVYFSSLAKKLAPHGYNPQTLIPAVYAGTEAMMKNSGSCTNEGAFWQTFAAMLGEKVHSDVALFEDYYNNEFSCVKEVCGFNPKAAQAVRLVKEKGLMAVLATNPLFPKVATCNRIKWAGLDPDDFALYTTYEDYSYCKPDINYYRQILDKLGLKGGECVMIGNDVQEDMAAAQLGMEVFILTDCIIDRKNTDLSPVPHGSFDDLLEFIEKL